MVPDMPILDYIAAKERKLEADVRYWRAEAKHWEQKYWEPLVPRIVLLRDEPVVEMVRAAMTSATEKGQK